jgi:hypothetical protein
MTLPSVANPRLLNPGTFVCVTSSAALSRISSAARQAELLSLVVEAFVAEV